MSLIFCSSDENFVKTKMFSWLADWVVRGKSKRVDRSRIVQSK